MSYSQRTHSATGAVTVTTSDDTTYFPPLAALYVGGTGDVAVLPTGSSTSVIFTAVPAGFILPVQVTQVLATGTTATSIVGLQYPPS